MGETSGGYLPETGASTRPLRALSHGAGVQTTTIHLMSLLGEIEPYDAVVFADTHAEPAEVYDHLAKLRTEADRLGGSEITTVSAGSLTERMLDPTRRAGIQIPAFMRGLGRGDGVLRRQCTERFKSRPVYKWLNHWRDGRPVALTLGISWDEVERMKPAKRKWATVEYPLIDRRMTRRDCIAWLADIGWTAPRSACVYCPYHGDAEWRRMRDHHPADFAEAVRVDHGMREVHVERIRTGATTLTGTPYVHRSLVPLDEVDLRTVEDKGQGSLFGAECDGWCGV